MAILLWGSAFNERIRLSQLFSNIFISLDPQIINVFDREHILRQGPPHIFFKIVLKTEDPQAYDTLHLCA